MGARTRNVFAAPLEPAEVLQCSKVITFTGANISALGVNVADRKIALRFWKISVDTAMRVDLEDEDGNDLDIMHLPATGQGGGSAPFSPILVATDDKDIVVRASAAGDVAVTLLGYYYR